MTESEITRGTVRHKSVRRELIQVARAPIDLRSLARAQTEMGLRVLTQIATDIDAPAAARVSAVGLIWERGWGKAPQSITGENGEGGIEVIVRHIIEGRPAPRMIEHSDNLSPSCAQS